jgi:transposase
MTTFIGVDPHKATHTAVAVDDREVELARITVRASRSQADELRAWAGQFDDPAWAVEAARGLGYGVAQGLVSAGEHVIDVPPVLAARVRTLGSGASDKTDRNDARAVAICARRDPSLLAVTATDHTRALALVAHRHRDLARRKTKQASRLHALFAELTPGGLAGSMSLTRANALIDRVEPVDAVDELRVEIAHELVAEIADLDAQMKRSQRRVAAAVEASATSLTDIVGIGPIGAATIAGAVGDPTRFGTRDQFASFNGTAPVAASSGPNVRHRLNMRGNRRVNHALHVAAICQLRRPGPGRTYFDRKVAEGKTSKEAIRCLKRRISNAAWRALQNDAAHQQR